MPHVSFVTVGGKHSKWNSRCDEMIHHVSKIRQKRMNNRLEFLCCIHQRSAFISVIYQRYLSALFISVQHLSAFNAIPQTVQVLLTFTIFQMRYPSVNMPSTNGWRSKDAFTEFVFGNLLK